MHVLAKLLVFATALSTLALLNCQQAFAQSAYLPQAAFRSQARPGVYGRVAQPTNNYRRSDARSTTNQRIGSRLPMAGFGNTARTFGPATRNGLPPTRIDSFIFNAGGNATRIYGDEGTEGLPPYNEFTSDHRINAGIVADRDAGLTTGHGSFMPDAWGNDEFIGEEWSQSGANGGNRQNYLRANPSTLRVVPKKGSHRYYKKEMRFLKEWEPLPADFWGDTDQTEGADDSGEMVDSGDEART